MSVYDRPVPHIPSAFSLSVYYTIIHPVVVQLFELLAVVKDDHNADRVNSFSIMRPPID